MSPILRSSSNLLLRLKLSLFKLIYLPLLLLDLQTDFLHICHLLLNEVAKPETFTEFLVCSVKCTNRFFFGAALANGFKLFRLFVGTLVFLLTLDVEGLWQRLRLLRSENVGRRTLVRSLLSRLLVTWPNFLRLVTALDFLMLFDDDFLALILQI